MSLQAQGFDELIRALESLKRDWTTHRPWQVGPSTEYESYVEWGTSRQRAQPYMRPAIDNAVSAYGKLVRAAIRTSNPTQTLIKLIALAIERYAKQVVAVDTGKLKSTIEAEEL